MTKPAFLPTSPLLYVSADLLQIFKCYWVVFCSCVSDVNQVNIHISPSLSNKLWQCNLSYMHSICAKVSLELRVSVPEIT